MTEDKAKLLQLQKWIDERYPNSHNHLHTVDRAIMIMIDADRDWHRLFDRNQRLEDKLEATEGGRS